MAALPPDRVVVVTGAARGIGRAIAEACAAAQARVVLVDRLEGELAEAESAIRATGGSAVALPCELTDEEAVGRLFACVRERFGRVDGLVNNAGTTVYGGALDTRWSDLAQVLQIHLAPTLLCAQAAARIMLQAGGGRIVNMASAAARATVTRLFGYSMAKAAIVSLTEHMAAELGGRGITVNALAPGPVLTEALKRNQDAAVQKTLRDGIPLERFAEPHEVAGAALFLLSDLGAYVNGHVLAVDGGLLASRVRLDRLDRLDRFDRLDGP
ncbi:MAG: 3-oxoacyl-[acyl-carrier-protein] reductase [Rubrivivax sp.]